MTTAIEVVVAGLGMTAQNSLPLLLLKERGGDRVLPVGIGPLEAQAIAMPLQGVRPPRPMTHDVFTEVIAGLGGHLRCVEITDLTDSTFHARLLLDQAGHEQAIDSRPSDAVALAVRTEAPIYVGKAVFDQAGIVPGEVNPATGQPRPSEHDEHLGESKLAPFKAARGRLLDHSGRWRDDSPGRYQGVHRTRWTSTISALARAAPELRDHLYALKTSA